MNMIVDSASKLSQQNEMPEAEVKRALLLQRLRRGAIILGAGLIVLSILMDVIGISQPGDIGTGQILIAGTGILILVIVVLGRRVTRLYQITALLLLNTILVLILIELAAIGLNRFLDWQQAERSRSSSSSIPQDVVGTGTQVEPENSWGTTYSREFIDSVEKNYVPFTIWRRGPFTGETIKVDEKGIRITPGAACDEEDAYTVFAFGGSAMWGVGAPDWLTIPAFLQAALDNLHDEPVCVINYGEEGYVMTQELIELILQLQQGNVPDVVIFFDGVNDVLAAFQNDTAYSHYNARQLAADFQDDAGQSLTYRPLDQLKSTNIGMLIERLFNPVSVDNTGILTTGITATSLDEQDTAMLQDVVASYLSNIEIVNTLGDHYGFDAYYFWQPVIFVGDKTLTADEIRTTRTEVDTFPLYYQETYDQVAAIADDYPDLYYLGNLFDDVPDKIYLDFVHLNPTGNEIIANTMLNVMAAKN